MKKFIVLIGWLGIWLCGHGQQNEKQIEQMNEQITANKVYIDYLEKGYEAAHYGLQVIHSITSSDFHLHFDFFESLKKVNPIIKNWAKVANIIAFQLYIIKDTRQTIENIKETHQFTTDELHYCISVLDNLLEDCLNTIDELVTIVTNGGMEMSDDQRIRRIDMLYAQIQDKYSFATSFSNEMGIVSQQRLSEQVEIKLSKKINGLQ